MFRGIILKAWLTAGVALAGAGVGYAQTLPVAQPSPAARANPGERVVLVNVLAVRVPAEFCERAGLKPGNSASEALTAREARMLLALIRAEPDKQILTSPQLLIPDGQEGTIQASQPRELVTGLVATPKGGATVYTPKKTTVHASVHLRLAPRVSEDGKSVLLRVVAEYTSLEGTPLALPVTAEERRVEAGAEKVSQVSYLECMGKVRQSVQHIETTLRLTDGGSAVVVGMVVPRGQGRPPGQPDELIWVLRTHIVDGAAEGGRRD